MVSYINLFTVSTDQQYSYCNVFDSFIVLSQHKVNLYWRTITVIHDIYQIISSLSACD